MNLERDPSAIEAATLSGILLALAACVAHIMLCKDTEPVIVETQFSIERVLNEVDCSLPGEVEEVIFGVCGPCEYLLELYDERVEGK